MKHSRSNDFISSIKFFDLLLEQFSGSEGELPLAITYLEQAAGSADSQYKTTLINIAKAKIRHADIMGSILLQIAQGQEGPLWIAQNSEELDDFLVVKGFTNFQYQRAVDGLEKVADIMRVPRDCQNHYPKSYVAAYILAEEKQMSIYKRLIELTNVPAYVFALSYARSRQERHRDELIELLKRTGC